MTADIPARTDADIEADLAALEFRRLNPGNVAGEDWTHISARLSRDVPVLLARTQKAEAERDTGMRCHIRAIEQFEELGTGIMQRIADGKPLAQLLAFVGNTMNDCDCVDDESLALWDRAALAAELRDEEAGRLRAELAEAKAENERLQAVIADMADTTFRYVQGRLSEARAKRDAAVAKVQAVEALCDDADRHDGWTRHWVGTRDVRAALASAATPEPSEGGH